MNHSPASHQDTALPPGTVAMLAARQLDAGLMRSLTAELSRRGTVHAVESAEFPTATAAEESTAVQAVRWSVSMEDYDDPSGTDWLSSLLETAAAQLSEEPTATVLSAGDRPAETAMLIMDVDSTLINEEVIELLAAHAGREAEVAEVTERAMRGELDFAASLHARVQALRGLPDSVLAETLERVTPTAGAEQLIAAFSRHSWPAYAVSGGFVQILEPLAARLGLTGFDANTLTVEQGRLAGTVSGEVVDRAAKRRRLYEWAQRSEASAEQVVAVGDGANDLDLVTAAGVGVAFCAKPALAAAADMVIRHRNLALIGYALGLPR